MIENEVLILTLASVSGLAPAAALVGGLQKASGTRTPVLRQARLGRPESTILVGRVLGALEASIAAALLAAFPSRTSVLLALTLGLAYAGWAFAHRRSSSDACGCVPEGVAVNSAVYRAAAFASLLAICLLGLIERPQLIEVQLHYQVSALVTILALVAAWRSASRKARRQIRRIRSKANLHRSGATLFVSPECEGCIRAMNALISAPGDEDLVVVLAGDEPRVTEVRGIPLLIVSRRCFQHMGLKALPSLIDNKQRGPMRWITGVDQIVAWKEHNNGKEKRV